MLSLMLKFPNVQPSSPYNVTCLQPDTRLRLETSALDIANTSCHILLPLADLGTVSWSRDLTTSSWW